MILTRVPLASVQWRCHCRPHVGQLPMDPHRAGGVCMGQSLPGTDSLWKPVFEVLDQVPRVWGWVVAIHWSGHRVPRPGTPAGFSYSLASLL